MFTTLANHWIRHQFAITIYSYTLIYIYTNIAPEAAHCLVQQLLEKRLYLLISAARSLRCRRCSPMPFGAAAATSPRCNFPDRLDLYSYILLSDDAPHRTKNDHHNRVWCKHIIHVKIRTLLLMHSALARRDQSNNSPTIESNATPPSHKTWTTTKTVHSHHKAQKLCIQHTLPTM